MHKDISKDLLQRLDYLIIQWVDKEQFQIIEEKPRWFSQYYASTQTSLSIQELFELFPILHSFLPLSIHHWNSPSDSYLESGIWEIKNSQNLTQYFSCLAIKSNEEKYLLIQKQGAAFEEKREILQKAREMQLQFEQVRTQHEKLLSELSAVLPDFEEPLAALSKGLDSPSSFGQNAEQQRKSKRMIRHIQRLTNLYEEIKGILKD